MPLPTFNPPVGPSPGTAHKPTVSLWEADFGEGYSQSTPKGINHIRKSVALRWDTLEFDQMREIIEFFEKQGGSKPFYFKPFGEIEMLKWTCKDWAPTTESGIWKISATLIQSFTNTV